MLNSDVVHQVMQSGFDHVHFRQDAELTDLMMVMTRPASNVFLKVMEQSVHSVQLALNGSTIIGVLSIVNEFGHLQQLVTFGVGFSEAGVVWIVVVQVEQKFVAQGFQPRRKVIDVREAAKLNRDRSLHNVAVADRSCLLWRVVVSVVVSVVSAVVISVSVVRDDVCRILMNHVVVRVADDVTV